MFRAKLTLMCLAITMTVMAQDSLYVEVNEELDENLFSPRLKPSIGFGLGTMSFYGDLGNKTSANNPYTSNAAFSFHAKLPMSSCLELTLTGIKSELIVNEPGLNLLNNFQSDITGGSAIFSYNFNRFLNKTTFWRPYIGTGISSFEFLSKTDLYDANGVRYHLWSNGALMSKPEDAADVHEAVQVERDFVYESDLRSLNSEEIELYQDYAVSIPISAGIDFKFSEHFKASLGTTMYFTLTDNVDNISSTEGLKKSNDNFLHTSLGFSYDLSFNKKNKKSYEEIEFENEEEGLMADYFDSDLDGVNDLDDDDLGHPEGVPVDGRGVPIDEDKDGVPDYRDDEPMTPDSLLVDEYGVAIDDADLLDKYMVWIDSLGDQTLYSKVFGDKPKDNFSVLIIPDKEGFNQSQINKILSEENVRQKGVDGSDGYLVGDYDNFQQAIDKKHELEEDGINGSVAMKSESGDMTAMTSEEELSLEKFVKGSGSEQLVYTDDSGDKVVYRVQVGAFRYDLSKNIFSNINDLIILPGNDGLTRYMSSSYESAEDAAERRVELLTKGFEGSFITAYQHGKRIKLSEAGLNVVAGANDLLVDNENNSIKKDEIKFRICLGEYDGDIPTADLEALLKQDEVTPEESGSVTRFMSKEFNSLEEAQEFISGLSDSGLSNPKIIGAFKGKDITLEEALKILGE